MYGIGAGSGKGPARTERTERAAGASAVQRQDDSPVGLNLTTQGLDLQKIGEVYVNKLKSLDTPQQNADNELIKNFLDCHCYAADRQKRGIYKNLATIICCELQYPDENDGKIKKFMREYVQVGVHMQEASKRVGALKYKFEGTNESARAFVRLAENAASDDLSKKFPGQLIQAAMKFCKGEINKETAHHEAWFGEAEQEGASPTPSFQGLGPAGAVGGAMSDQHQYAQMQHQYAQLQQQQLQQQQFGAAGAGGAVGGVSPTPSFQGLGSESGSPMFIHNLMQQAGGDLFRSPDAQGPAEPTGSFEPAKTPQDFSDMVRGDVPHGQLPGAPAGFGLQVPQQHQQQQQPGIPQTAEELWAGFQQQQQQQQAQQQHPWFQAGGFPPPGFPPQG